MKKFLLPVLLIVFVVPFLASAQTNNQTLLQSLLQQLLQLQAMLTQLIAREQTNSAINNSSSNGSSVTVLSPNGGEVYKQEDTIGIKWEMKNPKGLEIWVDLIDEKGKSLLGVHMKDGTNFYDWATFSSSGCCGKVVTPPGKYKIRLSLNDPALYSASSKEGESIISSDFSNNYFTIVSKNAGVSEKRSGIIKSVYSVAGRNWMSIDYIDWNPNWKPGGQSGSAYTNVNPQLRTFEIAPNAKIFVGSIGSGVEGGRAISYDKFANYFRAKEVNGKPQYDNYLYANPWDIEVVNGVVINIKEHYLP